MSTNTADPPVSQLTPTRKPGETQRLQTLCIEVPVTVQGSRNTHPSTPFLEETRTVIVFPQGAVLRLSEIVVQGQIVIVQNMRVKQEVACRVISSKPGATAKGYVELEFTQPAPGFWGISFPGEAIAPRPAISEAPAENFTTPIASAPSTMRSHATPVAPAEIAKPLSPMNGPAKLTPETTLELNAAIAASFANLREAVMSPETNGNSKPAIEKKEPVVSPAGETKPAPLRFAPPAPMPPVSRNVSAPENAPMNSATRTTKNPPTGTQANSPANAATTQNAVRSGSRQQDQQRIVQETAPVTLADSMSASETELMTPPRQRTQGGTQADWGRAPKPAETAPSSFAADSRRASGLNSEGLTLMADLGAAPDVGNQLLSAKAAERSRSGRNKMIAATAAVVLIAAGAGSYFWYSRTHQASVAADIAGNAAGNAPASVSGAGTANAPANSVAPNSGASNPQPAPAKAGSSQSQNARQPNNSAAGNSAAGNSNGNNSAANNPALKNPGSPGAGQGGSQSLNNHAANSKPNNAANDARPDVRQPAAANTRQPNVLPMKIAAPTAPTRNAAANNVAAPDLGTAILSGGTNANPAMMGTIISSSMPAPPPAMNTGSTSNPAGMSVVKEPKLITSVAPVYPKAAAMRGDVGVVTVDATVNEQGKVVSAKATDGPPSLRTAASDAVTQWKYQPAMLNGKPTTAHVVVKLMFKANH